MQKHIVTLTCESTALNLLSFPPILPKSDNQGAALDISMETLGTLEDSESLAAARALGVKSGTLSPTAQSLAKFLRAK